MAVDACDAAKREMKHTFGMVVPVVFAENLATRNINGMVVNVINADGHAMNYINGTGANALFVEKKGIWNMILC